MACRARRAWGVLGQGRRLAAWGECSKPKEAGAARVRLAHKRAAGCGADWVELGSFLASFAEQVVRQGYAPPRVRRAAGSNRETGGVGMAFLRMEAMGLGQDGVHMYVRMGGWACVGV